MSLRSTCRQAVFCTAVAIGLLASTFQGAIAQDPLARAASASANLAASRTVFEALPEADRKSMQEALIWTGTYSGIADGAFGRQTFDAIAAYQQGKRKPPSGVLNPTERAALQTAAQSAKQAVGFAIQDDPKTGARIGVPTSFLPKKDANPGGGSRWQSADGRVTLDTRTAPSDATLASLYDRNIAVQAAGRIVTYKVLRPDFLVIAGETATGKFYTRYDAGSSDLRGFSIGYDKALAPQVDRFVVAIANSFDPFPSGPAVQVQQPQISRPMTTSPNRRRLIATGIAVTTRRVVTTADVSSCRDMTIGDMPVRGLPTLPVGSGWTSVELPRDLPAALAPVGLAAAPTTGEAILVVSYTTEASGWVLSVIPGTMANERSIIAPLQPGASGAPVLDASNRLVGIVAPVSGDGLKVAGVMTTSRHAIVFSRELAAVIPAPAGNSASTGLRGAAEITSFWRPALVPISCAM